ncbi:MAG TPA: hypothetical protein VN948_14990 [Terriglobales bacterium]|nr:hypothetical protein [Terriglobales bacterium]
MRKTFTILATLLACFPCLHAQQGINDNRQPAASIAIHVPNDGSTGTSLYYLAKLTGTPSSTAVITATTDTSGIEGVVIDSAGKTGSALIAKARTGTNASMSNTTLTCTLPTSGNLFCDDTAHTATATEGVGNVMDLSVLTGAGTAAARGYWATVKICSAN